MIVAGISTRRHKGRSCDDVAAFLIDAPHFAFGRAPRRSDAMASGGLDKTWRRYHMNYYQTALPRRAAGGRWSPSIFWPIYFRFHVHDAHMQRMSHAGQEDRGAARLHTSPRFCRMARHDASARALIRRDVDAPPATRAPPTPPLYNMAITFFAAGWRRIVISPLYVTAAHDDSHNKLLLRIIFRPPWPHIPNTRNKR